MPDVVTFDPDNLLIIEINTGLAVNSLTALEIYSEWKAWLLQAPSRLGAPQAFSPLGGDPLTGSVNLDTTYFLINRWRVRPAEYSHKLIIDGNLLTDSGASIFVSTVGSFNVHTETVLSATVRTVTLGGVDQATVQAAMTAQGYTTTRAPKIDQLDAAVSTRATAGQGLTAGQDTKLTSIDSRVDVAVSTRAAPGQGLTSEQAAAMALLDVAVSTRSTPGQGLTSGESAALASILAAADVPVSTVAAAVWARTVDGSITAEQSLRLMNAVLGGKVSGAGTGTETFRDPADAKNRVVSTVDATGNRTSVTRDLS